MLMQRLANFMLRGRIQAMGTAFALGFFPVIGLLGSIIATLVTLRKGANEGALVFMAAVLPILLVFMGVPSNQPPSGSISTIDVVVMISVINATAWLTAVVLAKTLSWSMVLDVIGIVGVCVIVALHLCFPDMASWWQQWLTNYFAGVGIAAGGDAHSLKMMSGMIASMKYYGTGIAAIMFSFYALLDLLIARWWQDKAFNPGGLRKELVDVRLSKICGLLLLVGVSLSLMHVVMMQDAMLLLSMIFALAGLSLMHYVLAVKHVKMWWLILIYIVLSIVPESIILFVVAGILDTAFDFRKKFPVLM